jgi:hypothetical protein
MARSRVHRRLPLIAALLLTAASASAGPTCENRAGDGVRCGTPGAMPVGWTVSAPQREAHLRSLPPDPSPAALAGLACLIGAFFALIALMPDFDGRGEGDWDRQEGDDDERR